jgi:hypothetical protein
MVLENEQSRGGEHERGLVSGYKTAIPRLLAPYWKKPFSEQLSPVHVRPESHINKGTLDFSA